MGRKVQRARYKRLWAIILFVVCCLPIIRYIFLDLETRGGFDEREFI